MINIFEYIKSYAILRRWRYIIIHHSLTKDRKVKDWGGIKKWHTGKIGGEDNPYTKRPMRDIGYHLGLEFADGRYNYLIGRSLSKRGAHCPKRNSDGIGICILGNFDIINPCHQQYFMVASLCRCLQEVYGIETDNIRPHSDYSHKTCPGEMFSMDKLKSYIDGIKRA